MKPILFILSVLTLTLAADDLEPPRILGARIHPASATDSTRVVTLDIRHPHADTLEVQQVSDGRTNKLAFVHASDKTGTIIKFTVKPLGMTNFFRARAVDQQNLHNVSEWSEPFGVIEAP